MGGLLATLMFGGLQLFGFGVAVMDNFEFGVALMNLLRVRGSLTPFQGWGGLLAPFGGVDSPFWGYRGWH